MTEKQEEKKTNESIKIFVFVIVLVISLWLLTWWGVTSFINDGEKSEIWAKRGQFGDLFGSVNALFSGLAFSGLIYTIYLQRQELELQREELRLQREEMAASRGELANQVKIQKAICLTNIQQISVSAEMAEIEALKIRANSRNVTVQEDQAKKIIVISGKIKKLSSELKEIEEIKYLSRKHV